MRERATRPRANTIYSLEIGRRITLFLQNNALPRREKYGHALALRFSLVFSSSAFFFFSSVVVLLVLLFFSFFWWAGRRGSFFLSVFAAPFEFCTPGKTRAGLARDRGPVVLYITSFSFFASCSLEAC